MQPALLSLFEGVCLGGFCWVFFFFLITVPLALMARECVRSFCQMPAALEDEHESGFALICLVCNQQHPWARLQQQQPLLTFS